MLIEKVSGFSDHLAIVLCLAWKPTKHLSEPGHVIGALEEAAGTAEQLANDQAAGKLPLPPAPSDGGLHFPFFAVIVGPSSFKPYEGPDWWPPYGSSQVEGPAVDELPGLTMSVLQVPFDHETDIQIMACWLPGRVLVPMVQTAPFAK